MKKNLVILLINSFFFLELFANVSDPIAMTINGNKISLSEFEYIYNKNNSSNTVDKKTFDEYIDLFVNFKLKVEEAKTLGLDTTAAFKREYNGYVSQLSTQYLKDDTRKEELLKEAYRRKKDEVEAYHILVRIPNTGTSLDTLKAYNRAVKIYKRALKEDFQALARETSDEQPNGKEYGGYVGWILSFSTPSKFENTAFNTPVGKVAKPIRTQFGYHIIKVTNRRKSQGKVKTAHIFLLDNPKDKTMSQKNKVKIDSIYDLIKKGDDFGKLVAKYSQDQGSAFNQGELPWFGTGQMIPNFEKAAFALKDSGNVSIPVHTRVGWHIIRLLGKKRLESFDELKPALTDKLMRIPERRELAKRPFYDNLKKEYRFTQNINALQDFYDISEKYTPNDSLYWTEAEKLNKYLFAYADMSFTQKQFADYLKQYAKNYRGVRTDFIKSHYNTFVNNQLLAYERTQLSKKYPAYRNLINEYHDGILLFEVMNNEVWGKASQDVEGLAKYFDKNKRKYKWTEPHYKGRIIYCKDKSTLDAAKRIIKYGDKDSISTYLYRHLNDTVRYVKIERGLWKSGENSLIDAEIFKKGEYKASDDYPYHILLGKNLKTTPQEYTDVKGQLVIDYQDYLEKKWIAYLRKKYPVKVNKSILSKLK